tara:strand:+ start:137 stop:931 length:795 start_codon:yes stop_codon:yes gene_type:complete
MSTFKRNLSERARIANMSGNIRYQNYLKKLRKQAEDALRKATDEAKEKANKGRFLDNVLDISKIAAGFVPGAGPLLSGLLSVADMAVSSSRAANAGKVSGADDFKGTSYENIIKDNISSLNDQVKQTLKSRNQANILNNLLNIGVQLGSANIIPDKSAVDAAKSGTLLGDYGADGLTEMGINATKKLPKTSFFEMYKDTPLLETLQQTVPGLNLATGLQEVNPALSSLFVSGTPILQQLLRQDREATFPRPPMATGFSTAGRFR